MFAFAPTRNKPPNAFRPSFPSSRHHSSSPIPSPPPKSRRLWQWPIIDSACVPQTFAPVQDTINPQSRNTFLQLQQQQTLPISLTPNSNQHSTGHTNINAISTNNPHQRPPISQSGFKDAPNYIWHRGRVTRVVRNGVVGERSHDSFLRWCDSLFACVERNKGGGGKGI